MQSSLRHFSFVFPGTLAACIIVNGSFYFAPPWHEHGDLAINALQIKRAKHGHKLLSNGSNHALGCPLGATARATIKRESPSTVIETRDRRHHREPVTG